MTHDKAGKKSLKIILLLAVFLLACSAFLCVLYLGRPSDGADIPKEAYAGRQIRIIKISGVNNVRDIGGWTTSDGKRVRYGLIIRGGELDGIAALQNFADQLEGACFDTLNEGIATKDLVNLMEGITPTAVNSAGFIAAIRERLERRLA